MTFEEVEAVRTACADLVRLLRNMSEALAAASNATRLCAEAAEGIERDLIAISALLETDEDHPHAMTRTPTHSYEPTREAASWRRE
jgi:hypothetical protein